MLLKEQALMLPTSAGYSFEAALAAPGLQVIAEVKKASPSKGVISASFPYLQIAEQYEAAGAAAISVLTEPNFFLGSTDYLQAIEQTVSLPLLRKDFIIDAYQIYESKLLGASAILLICSLLNDSQLKAFIAVADALGMSALVEAHDEQEIRRALNCGARIVGVNNRDLATFAVDLDVSRRLRALVPADILFVAESGVQTAADAAPLAACGVDAVLIGEALMLANDKHDFIAKIKMAADTPACHCGLDPQSSDAKRRTTATQSLDPGSEAGMTGWYMSRCIYPAHH
jgi:indole-3-glycerol phosphate synthase